MDKDQVPARPLRIECPGAFYRVSSWGNVRKAVFKSEAFHLTGQGLKGKEPVKRHAILLYEMQPICFPEAHLL